MWYGKWLQSGIRIVVMPSLVFVFFADTQAQKQALDPGTISKYQQPLVIPPVMPRVGLRVTDKDCVADYYEIAVRQFQQQILPVGMPSTTVWGYGSVDNPKTFNYPAFTIEAKVDKPVIVKWINQLVDAHGNYRSHLFAVDQTLHWANPPGGLTERDSHGMDPAPYTGPVPIVTHLHGGHTDPESDGFPEAWYLPVANNIPEGYATTGTYYDIYKNSSALGDLWTHGSAVFEYLNDQRATTLWYHDHALGITRLNVYAGLAGFYLLRGGKDGKVRTIRGKRARLPHPAPGKTARPGQRFFEIPIVIQDRSFNMDGSLFYPDSRVYFDGFAGPYIPDSDIPPIWNTEFFGNTLVTNGRTWPFLEVEQRRYRFRFLNGCQSRTLILKMDNDIPFWQIGAEGGFLPTPVMLTQLLMSLAERADVIVDFSNIPVGTKIVLRNIGPDEPFDGGTPGVDFPVADPNTTGQVMQFRVIARVGDDVSTPPDQLVLPKRMPLGAADKVRRLSLNEEDSAVLVDPVTGQPIGPRVDLLGLTQFSMDPVNGQLTPMGVPKEWDDPITENPLLGSTEMWEVYNFTQDAHPVHLHLVQFEVVNREIFNPSVGIVGTITPPEPWETGPKDTVITYPGQITRVKAMFDRAGLFVWHCHILEHEDNEMMRPYIVQQRILHNRRES